MIHEFDSWSGVLHAISEALVWLDAVNFTLVRLYRHGISSLPGFLLPWQVHS